MKVTKNFMHEFGDSTKGKEVDPHKIVDSDYYKCWQGMKRLFDPTDPDAGFKKLKDQNK
jgi:hypothetical protein